MQFIFQAHDYSVNNAACDESCTIWTEDLASDTDAQQLLAQLRSDETDGNIKFSYWPA